jgi:hypothetical protein
MNAIRCRASGPCLFATTVAPLAFLIENLVAVARSFVTCQLLVTITVAGFFILGTNHLAYSASISSSAFVNLIDGPYENSSAMPNSSLSSSAGGQVGVPSAPRIRACTSGPTPRRPIQI